MTSGANWMNFNEFKRRFLKVPVEEYPNKASEQVPSPLVTVHIVTYNHRDFIRDAIEGVLMQQTGFPFEIIIGDDESTDGTREICLEYAKRYPDLIRLMLHKRKNNIAVLGRPCLIFQYLYNSFSARGKYIAVCSGDDLWMDRLKIQKQYDFLENNSNINRTYTATLLIKLKKLQCDILAKSEGQASSWMFLNFYKLIGIPIQMTQSIAEDTFTSHLLSFYGNSALTPDVLPTIIRRGSHNMYMTEIKSEMDHQRINTTQNILSALSIRPFKEKLGSKFVAMILNMNQRRSKLHGYTRIRTVLNVFRDVSIYGIWKYFIKYLFNKITK